MDQIAPADQWVQQVEWPVTFEWTDTDLKMGIIDFGAGMEGPVTIVSADQGLEYYFTDDHLVEIEVDGWAPAVFPLEVCEQWPRHTGAPAVATIRSRLQRSPSGEAYLQFSAQRVNTSSPVQPAKDGEAQQHRLIMDLDAEDRLVGLRFADSATLPPKMATQLDNATRVQLPHWWHELRLPVSELADLDKVEL